MKNKRWRFKWLCAWCICGTVSAVAQQDGGFWMKAGPGYRGGMKLELSGSSYTQLEGVHAANPYRSSSAVPEARDSGYGDRVFADGYVKRDAGTGNPNSIDPSLTWNWGYNNASQYNYIEESLSFHRYSEAVGSSRRTSRTTLSDGVFDADDTVSGWGVDVAMGYLFPSEGNVKFGLVFGLSGAWNENAKFNTSTYSEQIKEEKFSVRHSITDTYVYDVLGINMPGAGHAGTYDGPFDNPPVIPSPVIPNAPSSIRRNVDSVSKRTSSSTWTAQNYIHMEVDSDLYGLRLGPQLILQAGENLSFHITPHVSVNYADVKVERIERFTAVYGDGRTETLRTWHDKESEKDFLFGAGIMVGMDVEFGNGVFAGIWGGYDWMSDEVEVQAGPNTVSFDGSGYIVGLMLGYRFGGTSGYPSSPLDQVAVRLGFDPLTTMMQVREDYHTEMAQQTATGKQLYDRLSAWLQTSPEPEKVKRLLVLMKQNHPEKFVVLMDYANSKRPETYAAAVVW